MVRGKISQIGESVEFDVVLLREGSLEGKSESEKVDFWRKYEALNRDVNSFGSRLQKLSSISDKIYTASLRTNVSNATIEKALALESKVDEMLNSMNGNSAKQEIGEKVNPTIGSYMFALWKGLTWSTYGPTETHQKSMGLVRSELTKGEEMMSDLMDEARALSNEIVNAGGPKIEGLE